VYFNPLSIDFLKGIFVKASDQELIGVYNTGSRNGMSKSAFALAFAEELGLPTKNIYNVKISEVDFIKTYRPRDMRMDVSKIEKKMGIEMPLLSDEIKRVAEEYR